MSGLVAEVIPCPEATAEIFTGDQLRCGNSDGAGGALRLGEWHTVTNAFGITNHVCVEGSHVAWSLHRFDQLRRSPATLELLNPYADWKSGDSVRCLDAADSGTFLADNHIYEIENGPFVKSDKDRIRLVGLPMHEWNCERFERVAPIVDVHSEPDNPAVRVGSRVRCDDASKAERWISVGSMYTVSAIYNEDDHECAIGLNGIVDGDAIWAISRFTLLPDKVDPVVPAVQADITDAVLMPADHARQLADEHFMANGRELRLEIKAAIDAAVANGEYRANVHMSDAVYAAAQRWLAKSEYRLSSVDPGFTRRTISWQ